MKSISVLRHKPLFCEVLWSATLSKCFSSKGAMKSILVACINSHPIHCPRWARLLLPQLLLGFLAESTETLSLSHLAVAKPRPAMQPVGGEAARAGSPGLANIRSIELLVAKPRLAIQLAGASPGHPSASNESDKEKVKSNFSLCRCQEMPDFRGALGFHRGSDMHNIRLATADRIFPRLPCRLCGDNQGHWDTIAGQIGRAHV